jgi:NAD+ kinase
MKTIAVTANCTKPRAAEVLKEFARHAATLRLRLLADETTANLLPRAVAAPVPDLFDRADAIVALGGDGTMLRVARELNGRDKPVMGVNIGGLGFLTSVAEDELARALGCLANGDFVVRERAVAACTAHRADGKTEYRALNEVVVSKSSSSRVVTLDVGIDGGNVTSYVCDGLIVSTPTGSTGHSLSTGGPILSPETPAFVISPICPHTLTSRPFVVPDRSVISVDAVKSAGDLLLSVDGQETLMLSQGDRIVIRRAEAGVRLIHLPGYDYFSVLRQKLHWRGSSV